MIIAWINKNNGKKGTKEDKIKTLRYLIKQAYSLGYDVGCNRLSETLGPIAEKKRKIFEILDRLNIEHIDIEPIMFRAYEKGKAAGQRQYLRNRAESLIP